MGAVIELTDDEWDMVGDLFDPPVHRGAKGTIPRRQIVDAILWIARTGCQWRYLPDRFPDWQAVWSQWRRWRDKGAWAKAMRRLAAAIRLRHGRKADPTMLMIDGRPSAADEPARRSTKPAGAVATPWARSARS